MENIAEKTAKDQDEMKEKVRVVSLVDPVITKNNIGLGNNSNSSVWSLCDIHNDDSHIDLGDITPSISPTFTEEQVLELSEQQMVDPLTHRLLDDGDNIFSVDQIGHSLGAGQRKGSPLHDFPSDLESFDREMQFIEELDGVRRGHAVVTKELGMKTSNRDGKVGKNTSEEKDVLEGSISNESGADDNMSSLKSQRRRSPRKQGSSREETATGMALRRRRQNQATVEKDESLDKTKSERVLVHPTVDESPVAEKKDEDKVKSGPSRRSHRIAKHVVKELEEDSEQRNDVQEEELSETESDHETMASAGEEKVVEKDEMVINKNEEDPDLGETKTKELLEKNTPEKKDTLTEIDVQSQSSSVLNQNNDTSKPASKEVIKEEEENSKNVKTSSDTSAQKLTPASPEKRVTRSTTGNLKPKQAFDEVQEKLEIEKAKRLKTKTAENENLKCEENDENTTKEGHLKEVNAEGIKDNVNIQTTDLGKTESKSTEQKRKQDKAKDGKRKTKKEKRKSRKKSKANKSGKSSTESSDGEHDSLSSESSEAEVDFHADDSDYSPEDDPDRLWCICRKPHGNRFMICCDDCEEWFHGKCIGITMEQGRKMEKNRKEYVCDKCKEKKLKALMEEKARQEPVKTTTNPAIVREVYKHTRQGQKEPTAPVSAPVPAPALAPQPKLKPLSTVPVSSEPEEKKRKPAGFKIPKKVRTTPTPVSHISHQPSQKCIGEGCPRSSFEGAVYCGRSCIERHVSHAIKMLTAKEHGGKLHTSEGNRVAVIEKCSGRVIAGVAAPVMNHLIEWILKNPSFQVLVSGTSPASHSSSSSSPSSSSSSSSFYNKPTPEVKIKKEADRKSEEETIRSNVRRTMKEILIARKRESSDIRLSIEEIMKLVGIIEDGMHKAFKDTSHRYKAKYRTLMFNLKDPRNKVLYRRVLTGDIPPDKLIWMTSDELATKELAAWREQETKHMIDMIKKEEENTNKTRLIKKTHKGEVDVDDDDFSTLESSNTKEQPEEEQTSSTEANTEVLLLDTTDDHRAHLFDLNCKICTGKMAPPGEVVAKSPASVTNVPIQAAAESSVPSPREVTFVGPPSPDCHEFATASSPSKLSSKLQEKSVWKGFVMMQSVAKFGTNAYLVSGSADDLIQVLPDTLHVHGRIAHEQVWDYVFQCKTSSSREMSLIRFAAATDEEKISYVSLYSYFHSRKRCGVIGNCYSGVKDMYLIPLASHQPVPPELLPFKGPGLQEPRPHMLLGLIIRTKPATKRPRPVVDRQASSSPRAAGEPLSKRLSVNGTDTSKSTTPNSKTTTPTLPDSPVDEIEDIVFHFHNSQAKLDSEAAKPQPSSSTQPIAPMVTALLKINEQDKKLRSLQEQSERLEKEIAPKKPAAFPVYSAALSLSLDPSMSSVLKRLASSVPLIRNTNRSETSNETSNTAGDTDTLYDPETAYDEETPYDPEDLDLSSEDKDVSGTESIKETTVSTSLSSTTPSTGGLPEVKGDTGRISFKITPTSQDLPQTFVKGERGTAVKSSAVVDAERTVPRVVPEKLVGGDEEYEKRVLGQGEAPAQDGRSRSDVIQDPRRSRYRDAVASDTSQSRDFSEPRGHRDNSRDSDDSRRDTDDSKLHSSRARPNDRRWNDDRHDNYRERDDRQRGFFNRDRSHDRDRHSRDKWRR